MIRELIKKIFIFSIILYFSSNIAVSQQIILNPDFEASPYSSNWNTTFNHAGFYPVVSTPQSGIQSAGVYITTSVPTNAVVYYN